MHSGGGPHLQGGEVVQARDVRRAALVVADEALQVAQRAQLRAGRNQAGIGGDRVRVADLQRDERGPRRAHLHANA